MTKHNQSAETAITKEGLKETKYRVLWEDTEIVESPGISPEHVGDAGDYFDRGREAKKALIDH